jgi:quercetin dioxygenase-like cupin family protein
VGNLPFKIALLALCVFSAQGGASAATEPLLENDLLRASVSTYVPGETAGMHQHRAPRFVYVISGGTLRSTEASGIVAETVYEPDTCFYASPTSHDLRNVGDSTVVLLEVEVTHGLGASQAVVPCRLQSSPELPGAALPKPPAIRRSMMLINPDLIVTRVAFTSGSREARTVVRPGRLIYLLSGGTLEVRRPTGERTMATPGAVLWVDPGIALSSHPNGDLALIEIEPQSPGVSAAGPESKRPGRKRSRPRPEPTGVARPLPGE